MSHSLFSEYYKYLWYELVGLESKIVRAGRKNGTSW